MKKILAIALTLTLVFALAVSGSAAALNAKWTSLDCYFSNANVPNMTWDDFEGTADDTIKAVANSDAVDWGCAGATTNVSLASGVSFKIKVDKIANPGMGDSTGFVVAEKGADIRCDLTLGGQMCYETVAGAKGLTVTFLHFTSADLCTVVFWSADGQAIYGQADIALPADGVYEVVMTSTSLTVNGNAIPGFDAIYAAAIDFTDADLTIGTVMAGEAVNNIEILEVNGVKANLDAPVVGPADIEVVAIAGAMIVSLMAAAFVVKARKA